jgi:hypothetical protein
VTTAVRDVLLRQFDVAWQLAWYHLETLTTEECYWRPAERGLHVHETAAGWMADWPTHEGYDLGPSSAAWIAWHWLFWWRVAHDHTFGGATLTRDDVAWPVTADALRAELQSLHGAWRAELLAASDPSLAATDRVRWPFRGRSLADLFAWANTELTKSAVELGAVRFLFHGR